MLLINVLCFWQAYSTKKSIYIKELGLLFSAYDFFMNKSKTDPLNLSCNTINLVGKHLTRND